MGFRRRKKPIYRSFRLSKRIKPPVSKNLPTVRRLILDTCLHMWRYRKIFVGLIFVNFLLNLVLVKGLSSALDIPSLKDELQQSSALSGVAMNAVLLGIVTSSGTEGISEVSNLYQTQITIISILAFIWLFRETYEHTAKKKVVKLKQPFYEGMAPLIQFLLLLMLIGLQLLPMVAGVGIFSLVQVNGLAVTAIETTVWAILALSLSLVSFYLLSPSVFSLYIVTLPKHTPLTAYKSAKSVVAFRRWTIIRKLFYFMIIIGLIYLAVLFGCIVLIPSLTEWVMLFLSSLILPLTIGCGYKLYRSLL